jgi:hypothetical protein
MENTVKVAKKAAVSKYVNFPIELLKNPIQLAMHNALVYAVLRKTDEYFDESFDLEESFRKAFEDVETPGQVLTDKWRDRWTKYRQSEPTKKPMAGVKLETLLEFLVEEKTEPEEMTFRAVLAAKSIIGKATYKQTTNKSLVARMFGYSKQGDLYSKKGELPEEPPEPNNPLWPYIKKYSKRYQLEKVKANLKDWNVTYYGPQDGRGIYLSTKMDKNTLIGQVVKQKDTKKNKAKDQARESAELERKHKALLAAERASKPKQF